MKRYLVYPDILIYLRVNPETSLKRIADRGRKAEAVISLEYMQKLFLGYENFIDEMKRYTRILSLDWNQYQDVDEVVERISEKKKEKLDFLRDI